MQAAIELYKQKYGRYPAACTNSQSWSGQLGTQYECTDGSGQYIVGLAPEFIPVLPVDPKLNGTDSGYVYAVNSAGTVYKLAARKTVETETVTYSHPLKSCDADNTSKDTSQASFYTTAPICNKVFSVGTVSGRKPEWCKTNDTTNTFQISYAVWGGFAAGSGITVGSSADLTEDIICL
jgi:hypothetical protein